MISKYLFFSDLICISSTIKSENKIFKNKVVKLSISLKQQR